MARAFRATTRGYKAELQAHERRLLSQLCADVITMLTRRGTEVSGSQSSDDEFAHFRAELAGLGAELDDDADPGLQPPEDAALARLLPSASADEQEAAQFRRLAESSLRESKISDLRAARLALESNTVVLSESQAPGFGRALNDVRLTLATRLGIEEEADAEAIHENAGEGVAATTKEFMGELYAFATWLQETLFTAMLDVLPEDDER